jgi:hypothetical protein
MNIPYPALDEDPFWDSYEAQMRELDRFLFMQKLQGSLFIGGGGVVSFVAGTGILTWTDDFIVPILHLGKKINVEFGPNMATRNATLSDGAALVIEIPFTMTANQTQSFQLKSQLDVANHQVWVAAVRMGTKVYFRGLAPVG